MVTKLQREKKGDGKDAVNSERCTIIRKDYVSCISATFFRSHIYDEDVNHIRPTAVDRSDSSMDNKLVTTNFTKSRPGLDWTLLEKEKIVRKRRRKLMIKKLLLQCSCTITALLGLITFIADPKEAILDYSMKIAPGSRMLEIWQSPPISIFANVYVFNITNSKEALAGTQKLRVEEIGPFVYKEELRNTNVTFNDNDTMTYSPKRKVTFIREKSVADPKDLRVIVPNIALLGLGSMLSSASSLASIGFMTPLQYINSDNFLKLTVDDYLWGYEDPLVHFAHNYISSNIIPFDKLGLLDRMYDEGENRITIRLKDNGLDMSDPGYLPQYSIETWNGSPGNEAWGYQEYDFQDREEPLRPKPSERCKLLRGATEGILYPRNLKKKMRSYVYRKTFCRTMRIDFKHEGSFAPLINADWYGLPEEAFETPEVNPEHTCYCNPEYETCLPKGLADITPCYYKIPAAVSNPHFLGGDPSLIQAIDGLNPTEKNHGSYAVLQPELGSVLDFLSRTQTNLVLKNIQYNTDLLPLANLTIPLFWVELKTDGLNLESMMGLYFLLVFVPTFIFLVKFLGVLSALYLILSFVCKRYCKNPPTAESNDRLKDGIAPEHT